jgi:hypothetical protein
VDATAALRRIRVWLAVFILGLVASGVTAFPLVHETAWLVEIARHFGTHTAAFAWVSRVHAALAATNERYPFLAYGTDWLAFAHLVLAAAFIGPWRDPVRNKWVLQFGLIACAGVLPLALIAGAVRGIPLWWRFGDCCFGIFGTIPLLCTLRDVRALERG